MGLDRHMRKRALVFGITGQTGSYLAELLLSKDYDVYGVIRRSSTTNLSRIFHIADNIKMMCADLTDAKSVLNAVGAADPDEIYNLAAQSFVPVSWTNPTLTFDVNTIGFINILESAKNLSKDIRIYQASSSEMYGNSKDKFEPRSPYGVSKLASHWIANDYRDKYGMFICSGICFNHESPRRGGEFVTQKIAQYVKAKEFTNKLRLGSLSSRRDWGFAGDYVIAMWLMLQQEKPDDYVVAMGRSHTVGDFCREAFKVIGVENWKDHVEEDPQFVRKNEVFNLVGDPSKIKSIGWEPKVSFEELVRMMVDA